MSTEQKDTEQNALATRLGKIWGNFKQGKIISYKWMAILLIVTAAIGVTWYIVHERKAANSKRWMDLDEASTPDALEEYSTKNPGTIQDRLARLQRARNLLGDSGIELLGASNPELRSRGVANIEKARELFQKLLDDFKGDPVFKAECLLGLAKAEAALVAIPTSPGQLTEFKGSVSKTVEYLDQLAEAAAPNTPWATDAKKLADALRDEKAASSSEFVRIQRSLFSLQAPGLPKTDDPFGPLGPLGPPSGAPGVGPPVPGVPGGK